MTIGHVLGRYSYVSLSECLQLTRPILSIDVKVLRMGEGIDQVESALLAPQGSFGGHEFYPTLEEKVAVLLWHMARSQGLPDGNKRTAWLTPAYFAEKNGFGLLVRPEEEEPVVVDAAQGLTTVEEVRYAILRWLVPLAPQP